MRLLMTYPQIVKSTELFQAMDPWFQQTASSAPFCPEVDLVETEESYRLSLDLPGLTKDQIQIDLNDRKLTISGERKRIQNADQSDTHSRIERRFGTFARSFTLPASVDTEQVEAIFENGVLELSLKKTPASRPRRIEVKTTSAH